MSEPEAVVTVTMPLEHARTLHEHLGAFTGHTVLTDVRGLLEQALSGENDDSLEA